MAPRPGSVLGVVLMDPKHTPQQFVQDALAAEREQWTGRGGKATPPLLYRDMTSEQMLAWGKAEAEARQADLSVRTVEGLKAAQENAEARRKLIGASRSAAASMVSDALRAKRVAEHQAAKATGSAS